MAFNPAPTEIFPGWSEDGTDITIPIADIPELTAAEADAVTGDSRKIIYALLEALYQWYLALPSGDRPGKVTISRSDSSDPTTGRLTKTYAVQVVTIPTGIEVADE